MFSSRGRNDHEAIDYAVKRTRYGVTARADAADHRAYDQIRGFYQRGINVPGDVSVTALRGLKNGLAVRNSRPAISPSGKLVRPSPSG